jgi:hypothetical protein
VQIRLASAQLCFRYKYLNNVLPFSHHSAIARFYQSLRGFPRPVAVYWSLPAQNIFRTRCYSSKATGGIYPRVVIAAGNMRLGNLFPGGKMAYPPSLPFFKPRSNRRFICHNISTMKLSAMMALLLTVLLAVPAAAKPIIRAYNQIRESEAGLEILQMTFSIKMAETALALLSVTIVASVYSFLIRRGSLLSTTAMYPRRSIEDNIGSLLSEAWPDAGHETECSKTKIRGGFDEKSATYNTVTKIVTKNTSTTRNSIPDSVKLFYLGKMTTDNQSDPAVTRVAKGVLQCATKVTGPRYLSPLWLTSGSPITKDVVQLLVWEWASFWLILLMLNATLMYNGFFTNTLSIDSYPRLTVMLIYATSYIVHAFYVWNTCSRFLTNVASGATWSLLERAMFAIGETKKLQHHRAGNSFEFRSIDKASEQHIPTTFRARFKHENHMGDIQDDATAPFGTDRLDLEDEEDVRDMRAALATIAAAQKSERKEATDSARKALERVVSNAMVMMGVTLSTGFSAWTAQQSTEDTPNNFDSTMIGSLALLASLSLGAATMFTSALHLSIMDSSYRTILSLKETKINGHAVDHYKKRRAQQVPLSFTSGTVPSSKVRFVDILMANRWKNFLAVALLGPSFALLPSHKDHERTSADVDFDLVTKVRDREVLLTTRSTEQHAKGKYGTNVEPINVCYIEAEHREV